MPDVAGVAVDGCEVCMAALDGRVACFGTSSDTGPFESSPRVVADRVCSASGPGPDRPMIVGDEQTRGTAARGRAAAP